MKPTIEQVKQIREQTVVSERRQARELKVRRLHTYVHHNGKYAAMAEFGCETDFVANSDVFKNMMNDICMQVAVTERDCEVEDKPFIKDPTMTVKEVLATVSTATGERGELLWYKGRQV